MMEATIADQLKTNINFMKLSYKTKQILICLFLLCFAFIYHVTAQTSEISRMFGKAQMEFDDGKYNKAIEIAGAGIEKARNTKANLLVSKGLEVVASSQISLTKYKEAEISLNEALQILPENEGNSPRKAEIYLHLAWLWRSQRKTDKALEFGKKALATAPHDRQIQGEYYLNIGRILFSSGYDISAIIWLEKAEIIFETERTNSAKLDTYRFLSLSWSARLDFQKSLKYLEKLVASAENTQYKYKYRQALFELGSNLSATGQITSAFRTLENGLRISLLQKIHIRLATS